MTRALRLVEIEGPDEPEVCASLGPGPCVYVIIGLRRRNEKLEAAEVTVTHQRALAETFFHDDAGHVDVAALFCTKSTEPNGRLALVKASSPLPWAWMELTVGSIDELRGD